MLQPLEGAGLVGNVGRVMVDKIVGEPGDVARPGGAAVHFKPPLDQLAGSRADHRARRLERHRRQAFAGEDEIQRTGQVRRRIDQRAVKVEYDRANWAHGGSLAAPAPSRKSARISPDDGMGTEKVLRMPVPPPQTTLDMPRAETGSGFGEHCPA